MADTNFLLSYFTDRNLIQQKIATKYIESSFEGKSTIHIPETTLTELVYVLTSVYNRPVSEIKLMIHAIDRTPGIFIDGVDLFQIFSLWPDPVKDWGDALLAVQSSYLNAGVLSFDRAFQKQLTLAGILNEKI